MASIFATRPSLAVDLTSTGAPVSLQRERDPETESFIMARLAGLAKLLDRGGADLITIGPDFRFGGRRRREDILDPIRAISRLGKHTHGVNLAACVPLPETTGLRSSGPGAIVVANVRTEVDVEIAAARANVARLRVHTMEEARNLRTAIRSAAPDWGRAPEDIAVLVDIRAVLADDLPAAQNRALFIDDLTGDVENPNGTREGRILEHVGTATTMANVWQNWVRAGASDGFTIIPASVPTDVIAIATTLVPELQRRGLRPHAGTSLPGKAAGKSRSPRVAA